MTPTASAFLALDGRLTVVEAAAGDGAWADRVLAERPETRLLRLARGRTAGLASLGGLRALDRAAADGGLRHLNYLRIAEPTAAMPVLLGAQRLLSHARIDVIEIGGALHEAASAPVGALLGGLDFVLLPPSAKLDDLLLVPFDQLAGGLAVLGLHKRLTSAIAGDKREPDLAALMAGHGLAPRGIIHVGAHNGEEVAAYLGLGFERVLLVEANPALAASLAARFADEPRVAVESCAVTDADGTVDLHIASSTVASSILELGRHADMFPDIRQTGSVPVRARTLDGVLADPRHAGGAYNIAVIDIQGAELLALRGANRLLPALDGLLIEVNFAELYQGSAQIEDIDDLLFAGGFARVMTMSPYRSAYGDAFYRRTTRP